MRPTKAVAAVSVAVAVLLTLSTGPVAHAAQVTVDDVTGDVRVISHHDAEHQQKLRTAPVDPAITDHDIIRTRFAHTRKQLVVTTKFRSLRGVRSMEASELRIRVPKRVFSYSWMRAAHGVSHALVTGAGADVACRVKVATNRKRATRTIRIPRRCLGNPTWVRVASKASTADADHLRVDNAHGKRAVGGMTKRLRVG